MTLQGLSCKEIAERTGFKTSLISQYRYKVKQKLGENKVLPPGHNVNREKCKTCQYRARDPKNKNGCDYIEHTGHSRGCSVADCDKYEKGERLPLKNDMQLMEKE